MGFERLGQSAVIYQRAADSLSVADINRLYARERGGDEDADLLRRAIALEALPETWRAYFRARLARQARRRKRA